MSDLDKILDDFRTNAVAWDSKRGIKKAEAKSELLNLILKALPEKKDITKDYPDAYPTKDGYNQALKDTEKAIRKALE